MQLSIRREQVGVENHTWLGSAHGTSNAQTVTLDATKLAGVTVDGAIPSGIPLKKSAAGGKFEPVTDAGDELAGFLFTTQAVREVGADVVAPMLDHGRIRVGKLPAQAFDVTTLTTLNPAFIFVKEGDN